MKEELLIPAVAALVVGLIAGIVSLVVSILSKDQKTSEFRQLWIDGLRDDVSQLTSHLGIMKTAASIIRGKTKSERDAYFLEDKGHYVQIYALINRIRLRLNSEEHAPLIDLLITIEKFDGEGAEERIETICTETQKILKSEWERVKRGEPSFIWLKRISKWGVVGVLTVGTGVCAANLLEYLRLTAVAG